MSHVSAPDASSPPAVRRQPPERRPPLQPSAPTTVHNDTATISEAAQRRLASEQPQPQPQPQTGHAS